MEKVDQTQPTHIMTDYHHLYSFVFIALTFIILLALADSLRDSRKKKPKKQSLPGVHNQQNRNGKDT